MTERDLTLVGLDGDGTRLVLTDDEGERYAVPLDERLRSLVHPGRNR